jgi:hypothetical protein
MVYVRYEAMGESINGQKSLSEVFLVREVFFGVAAT